MLDLGELPDHSRRQLQLTARQASAADLDPPPGRRLDPTWQPYLSCLVSTFGTGARIRKMEFDTQPNSRQGVCCGGSRISSTCVLPSASDFLERDPLALRSPCAWCFHRQLRPRPRPLRRFAPRSDRVPVESCLRSNGLESASCSMCPLASAAKCSLRLRSEFVLSEHENRVRNGVWNINDSQVAACMRLPEGDSHSSLSGSVFHRTIQDRLDSSSPTL